MSKLLAILFGALLLSGCLPCCRLPLLGDGKGRPPQKQVRKPITATDYVAGAHTCAAPQLSRKEALMEPIDFPQANRTLGPPSGMDNCGGLRVWTQGEFCVSSWMPTEEERARLAAGEPVWLFVWFGATQPPVALQVGTPFDGSFAEADSAFLRELGVSPGSPGDLQ